MARSLPRRRLAPSIALIVSQRAVLHASHSRVFFRVHFAHPVFLFFAAFLAGTINSVAGGGSFISFPALLFTGIPPIAANATNTVAVWPGTLASTVAYRNAFTPDARRLLLPLIGLGILGGVLGAHVLLHTPQATFVRLIPWLLLGATLLFLSADASPPGSASAPAAIPQPLPAIRQLPSQFAPRFLIG